MGISGLEKFSSPQLRPLGAFSDFVVEKLPKAVRAVMEERVSKESVVAFKQKLQSATQTVQQRAEDEIARSGWVSSSTKRELDALKDAERAGTLQTQEYMLQRELEECLMHIPEPFAADMDYEACSLALLDLTICESALTALGMNIPEFLWVRTEQYASFVKRTPGLSYQGIILDNPSDDMRCFTDGAYREHEVMFYETHQQIEKYLSPIIHTLLDIAETESITMEHLKVLRQMEDAEPRVTSLNEDLRLELDRNAFAHMRTFYTNKDRGLPGPSGLYSASFPVLDVLLNDTLAPEMFVVEGDDPYRMLPQNSEYTQHLVTAQDLLRAKTLREKIGGESLISFTEKVIAPQMEEQHWKIFKETMRYLVLDISSFRHGHKRSVQKFIPEVLSGESQGTAGVLKTEDGESAVEQSLDALRDATVATMKQYFQE